MISKFEDQPDIEIRNTNYYIEIIRPYDIYSRFLRTINGISFTSRQIDIIAGTLAGRNAAKIASLLSLKPKAISNNITHIAEKLEFATLGKGTLDSKNAKTKENIIDFVEKSKEFTNVNNHYRGLLVEELCNQTLKQISSQVNKKRPTCLIIYDGVYKDKNSYKRSQIYSLGFHLKLAGFSISMKPWEAYKTPTSPLNLMTSQAFDYVIYQLSSEFLEKLETQYGTITLSVFDVANTNTPHKTIFISLEIDSITFIPNELFGIEYIGLEKQKNYYFLVLEILRKLLPTSNLDNNILEFKRQYKTLVGPSPLRIFFGEDKLSPIQQVKNVDHPVSIERGVEDFLPKLKLQPEKKITITKERKWIIATLLAGVFLFATVHFNQYMHPKNDLLKSHVSKSKLENITSSESSPLLEKLDTKKIITWNIPRQDQIFIGRKKLLEDLEFSLHDLQKRSKADNKYKNSVINNKRLAISACAGMGGIGKTQLVLQYIHHSQHPYTLRAWFHAENIEQLKQEYFKFAKRLGYPEEHSTFEEVLIFVKNWLVKNPGWLIIYDNVNSYKEIQNFLPESGGHVIITSRMRYWPDTFLVLPIDVMSEEEAVNFLNSTSKNINSKESMEARELAKALGFLPLALAQARAYIYQNQISISKYLKLYKTHALELLSAHPISELAYNTNVVTTWNISLAKLAKEVVENHEALYALDLIMVAAYLAPENISRELLLVWFKEAYPNLQSHELILHRIIGQLWKYSLIHIDTENSIGIHRLLQSVLRIQHNEILKINGLQYPARTIQWFDNILKSFSMYYKLKELEGELRDQNLLSHLQMLESHSQFLKLDTPRSRFGIFENLIGQMFFSLGDLKSSLSYFMRSLKIGEDIVHNGVIGYACNNIGLVLDWMGDPKTSKIHLERSLKVAKEYPNEYDFMEVTMSNLGQVYRHLGETRKAKELLETSLKLIEKRQDKGYGKAGVWMAMNLCQLAEVYGDLGESTQAIGVFEKALEIREKYFGKNDRKVAETLIGLAESYINTGNPIAAKEALERSLDIFEKDYGKGHILNAKVLTALGNAYRELGKSWLSKKILEEALNIRRQYYGSEYPEVMETFSELGKTYARLGEFHQAKNILEEVRRFQSRYYGENHIKVAHVLFNLSHVYAKLKDVKIAEEFMRKSHKIFILSYGESHPLTQKSDMDQTLKSQGIKKS